MFSLGQSHMKVASTRAYTIKLLLNNQSVEMEIDSGASLSVINFRTYLNLKKSTNSSSLSLKQTDIELRTFPCHLISPKGLIKVPVKMKNNQEIVLPLIVIEGNHPDLLGRNWLYKILYFMVQSTIYY